MVTEHFIEDVGYAILHISFIGLIGFTVECMNLGFYHMNNCKDPAECV